MLKLRDFLHLPQLDPLINQLIQDGPGVILLAGVDARPTPAMPGKALNPSGLSAMFNILMQEILLAHPLANAVVVAKEGSHLGRAPRLLKRRVGFIGADSSSAYQEQIEQAARQRPTLLVIDHLDGHCAAAAFNAAQLGVRVLAQVDTILRGPSIARQMLDFGVPRENLCDLSWVVTMQRMSVLCAHCRKPAEFNEATTERICGRYPRLRAVLAQYQPNGSEPARFFRASGCQHCHQTGYQGDMAVFDLFHGDPAVPDFFSQSSLLPLEEYALRMAAMGQIDLGDLLDLDSDHLRRTHHLLTTSERALSNANAELSRRLMELETTNRVLLQRTEALISLQELGQALISSNELDQLAESICRRVSEMCKADRVVLYLRRVSEQGAETAEVLAVHGWDDEAKGRRVSPSLVFDGLDQAKPIRYTQNPPGVRPTASAPDVVPPGSLNLMGLRVPLLAQDQMVGVMVMQSTRRATFKPGEVALVQTYANQAALAIQRTRLVEELRGKIAQLEVAQEGLVKKERMERELELARQVQQSMLPQHFPEVSGFAISASSEPARQVGGDFYDVILLDDDHFGLVIADVADKGMPAALYMALTRSLLLAEARREQSPRQALLNVNRLLLELGELSGFVSVFYGVIERSTRRFTYSRAGHERPLLLRSGSVQHLPGSGTVLGILEGDQLGISEEMIQLFSGDRLVMFTDGITDATAFDGSFFGLPHLEELLQSQSGLSAEQLCQTVFTHLAALRGSSEPFDDMTLLTLEVL
jgi:serine phosphatase RsbU (regulator of sigma subunit)